MIFIVTCCHGAKLCAHAARDFRSQLYNIEKKIEVYWYQAHQTYVTGRQ